MLRLVVAMLITVIAVMFAMANSHHVELSYVVGEPIRIRMIFLVASVFVAGMATAYFYQLAAQMGRRSRRVRSELKRDEE